MKIILSSLVFGLLLVSANPSRAYANTVVFQQGVNGYTGGEDSEISSDAPTNNYSSGGSVYADREAVRFCGAKCNKIVLRFKALGITGTITNVKLEVKESGQQGGSNSVYAHKLSRPDWVATETTWNSYKSGSSWTASGGDAGAALGTASAPGTESWMTLDLGNTWTVNELQQNGILIDTDIPGWNYTWFYSNESANTADRPKLTITYDTGVPDTIPPTVSIANPLAGSTLSGSAVALTANAFDDSGFVGVQFKVDGSNVGTEDTSSPYTTTLDTTGYVNGTHSISATARDAAGNQTTTSPVSVTVSNVANIPTPPIVTISASPSVVASGSGTTLTWSSSSATSCTASDAWSGAKATSGSQTIASITANSTFTLSCTGSGGTTVQSVTVYLSVTPPSGSGLVIDLSYVNQLSPEFARFKSVVDAALAGSPDYGFEPQHAALMAKITGDQKYCDYAITFAESCPNSYDHAYGINCGVVGAEQDIAGGKQPQVAGDSYLEVGPIIGSLALTYNWCGSRMTASQKTRWEKYASQAIYNVWHPSLATWGGRSYPWSGWSITNPGNNYYYSFLEATMYWALATHDATLLSFTRNEKLQPLVDYYAQIPGGGSLEGTGYGASHMRLFELYQVWKDSTGEDLSKLSSHLSDSIRLWTHATTPNRAYYAPIGDLARSSFPDLFDYHRRLMLEARHLTTNTATADLASWWLNHVSVTQMSRRIDAQWDLLPKGVSVASAPTEPLAYRATGIGRIFARTGWDTNALWMTFAAGKYVESHAHQDQGSFDLANNGWLAVSNNIFSASGIEQTTDYHNVLRFSQNGSIIPQREGTESTMTVNQLASNGDVDVTGNLTPAYGGNPAIKNWTRNVKFAARKLTVTDTFSVTPGTQATFQVDVPVAPVVNGNLITAGGLSIRVVSPATPTIQVVSQGKYRIDIGGGTTGYVVELSDQPISSNPPPPSNLAPTVSLAASPVSVMPGVASTLTWSSTNATSCTASGGWAGAKATSGSLSVSPTVTTTYTLTCTGAGGTTAQSVTVTVSSSPGTEPPPIPPSVVPPGVVPPVSSSTTPAISPKTTFSLGARVKTTAKLSVRAGAGTTNKRLCVQPVGALGTIAGGSVVKNGYTWWRINFDASCDGWSIRNYLTLAPTQLIR